MGKNTESGLTNAVTLRIWMPNGATTGALGPLATFLDAGHASLTVKLNGERHYITWQVEKGMPNGREQPARDYINNPMTKRIDESYMKNMGWGKMGSSEIKDKPHDENRRGFPHSECTHKIRLTTLQPNQTRPSAKGLDASAIIDWWDSRRQTEKTYHLISTTHNCTGCVTEALHAGGLGGKPTPFFVLTAADIYNWVVLEGKKQGLIWA